MTMATEVQKTWNTHHLYSLLGFALAQCKSQQLLLLSYTTWQKIPSRFYFVVIICAPTYCKNIHFLRWKPTFQWRLYVFGGNVCLNVKLDKSSQIMTHRQSSMLHWMAEGAAICMVLSFFLAPYKEADVWGSFLLFFPFSAASQFSHLLKIWNTEELNILHWF